jgi:surfactin family lipopeptide synthetase A
MSRTSSSSTFIINAFRATVSRLPEATAIIAPDRTITYRALNERVNGLAAALHERGIGPMHIVGIHMDRSIEMVIALLGVIASGAAYVPLDPSYPFERNRLCLEDSGASLVLATNDSAALVDSLGLERLDPKDWPIVAQPEIAPTEGVAYLMYTSGSTGKPKGVVIEHIALGSYLSWCLQVLPFHGSGVPLFSSVSFDHSITTLYPPLMVGEPLVLMPPIEGGRALASGLLDGRQYSYVKITPSHLRLFSTEQRAALGKSTMFVMLGGERLSTDLISHLRRDNPTLEVMNHYGPTETSVGCCTFLIPLNFNGTTVPIGKPLPGMVTSIRRSDGTVSPHGEAGEIYIGGDGLAREYWRQPDLTARFFVHAVDTDGTLRRYYRTGDIMVERSDGNLEFLGRADEQIKIFGHRIDLMEVESVLRDYPHIRDASVLSLDREGLCEIVAAVIPQIGTDIDIEEVRHYMKTRLPPAMLPSLILPFDTIPVTENGKIDRQAIRQKALRVRTQSARIDGSIIEQLTAKWYEVLGNREITPDDDFFELGGDSLATVEIAIWASKQFQIKLEPMTLFEYPTLYTLAGRIHVLIASG